MSEVDIIIREAIQALILSGEEVSIATVQQALADNPFFTERSIHPVPTNWIESILAQEGGPYPTYHGVTQ